jgi:hypothetical protein
MKLYLSLEQSNGGVAKMGPRQEIELDSEYPFLRSVTIQFELNGRTIYKTIELFHSPYNEETLEIKDVHD